MTRIALAVVLAISISFLAYAQHHPGGSGSAPSGGGSSSGGSSSSGGGFSGSSSGGYSGGSGASHPSSSSSGSSGGYSGGSRGSSSSGASAASSNGSSSANHSGHTYTGSASPSNSQPSGARNSANSNIRNGNTTGEGARGNADYSHVYVGTDSHGGSVNSGSRAAGDVWMHASPSFDPAPVGLDKTQRAIFFSEQMRAMGLETSKSAYDEKLASIGVVEPRRPSWLARMFGAKATPSKQQAVADIRKPCNGPQCRPWPPPKPCNGPNCKPVNPPVPPPKPVSGICSSGFPNAYGLCQPWGYVGNCRWDHTLQTPGCFVNYASFDPGYCSLLLQRIQTEQAALTQLTMQKNMACSNAPQGQACFDLSQRVRDNEVRLQSLQRQYQMCRTGAHLP